MLIQSITGDRGIELVRRADVTANLVVRVHFCDAHSPWRRGSKENCAIIVTCGAGASVRIKRNSRCAEPSRI